VTRVVGLRRREGATDPCGTGVATGPSTMPL
jgi:hypothetical protein